MCVLNTKTPMKNVKKGSNNVDIKLCCEGVVDYCIVLIFLPLDSFVPKCSLQTDRSSTFDGLLRLINCVSETDKMTVAMNNSFIYSFVPD